MLNLRRRRSHSVADCLPIAVRPRIHTRLSTPYVNVSVNNLYGAGVKEAGDPEAAIAPRTAGGGAAVPSGLLCGRVTEDPSTCMQHMTRMHVHGGVLCCIWQGRWLMELANGTGWGGAGHAIRRGVPWDASLGSLLLGCCHDGSSAVRCACGGLVVRCKVRGGAW